MTVRDIRFFTFFLGQIEPSLDDRPSYEIALGGTD